MAQVVAHLETALEEPITAVPSILGADSVVGQNSLVGSNRPAESIISFLGEILKADLQTREEVLQSKGTNINITRKPYSKFRHFDTYAYMNPVYFVSGRLTKASDVYSFGIVLLVVLSGMPAAYGSYRPEKCLHEDPKHRPVMAQVVVNLEESLELLGKEEREGQSGRVKLKCSRITMFDKPMNLHCTVGYVRTC